MEFYTEYFCCSEKLLSNIDEIKQIYQCIKNIEWKPDFSISINGIQYSNQTAYNKAFEIEFEKFKWEKQPLLHKNPKLIGDFRKNDVFIEIQFGNSATLFRDYYKFHFGLVNSLLSVAVLIVPVKPKSFFPTRPRSVNNMAEYSLALKYFNLLPIPIPILLIGLIPN